MQVPLSGKAIRSLAFGGGYLLATASLFYSQSGGADGFVRVPFALPLLLCIFLALGAGTLTVRVGICFLAAASLAAMGAGHPHNYTPWNSLGRELATFLAGGLMVAGVLSLWRLLGVISQTGNSNRRVTLVDLMWIVTLACVAAAAWSSSDVPPLAVGYFWDRVLGSALLGSAAVLMSLGPKPIWQFVGALCALAVFPRHGWTGTDVYVSLAFAAFQSVNLFWAMLPLLLLRRWGYLLRR